MPSLVLNMPLALKSALGGIKCPCWSVDLPMCAQEGNVIMQPDGEVDIPVRRPDGDVELKGAGEHFYFPPCSSCGGILKPNVVFFGDTIPKPRALKCVNRAA